MGKRRGVYSVLVGKPEGKRTFGRHMHRWEGTVKMHFQKLESGDMKTGSSWLRVGKISGHL
jgi:hypothetical protein